MRPRLSIIVPCYNAEQYLRETLDCLLSQTIEDWECIVVNDGSTDGSLEIMKEFSEKDSRYRFIDKRNEGPAIARNTGIQASCGEYILPLDADDLIAPVYGEKAIEYLEKHPECKVVYGQAEFIGLSSGIWKLPDYDFDDEIWQNAIFCTAIYRRKDYDLTIGYNPNMKYGNEDYDFWLSLLKREDTVYKLPETVLYYRKHGESHSNDLRRNHMAAMRQLVLNHIDRFEPYLSDLYELRWENQYLKDEIEKIRQSSPYRIGRILTFPFRRIQRLLNNIKHR